MRNKFFIILLFIAVCVSAQVDTANLSITHFGQPNREGRMDHVRFEVYKLNANDLLNEDRIDSSKSVFDYENSIASVDSIRAGAIVYTDTYWDDLRVPLTNTRTNPALSEPDFEDMGGGTFGFGFDADADSTETLHFAAQLPHEYKVGTDLGAHIHWTPETTNTGNVRWKLAYQVAAVNGTLSTIAYLWVTDAADGTALKHQLAGFGDIDGSSLGISSMIIGWVSRVGDDDTFTGSAYAVEIDFHYQIDTPGSEEETSKY